MTIKNIVVPDIGSATNVDVIEIQVANGDTIEKDQSLITLEGDKATMDIPSPFAGTVKEIKLKVGDKVSKDNLILTLETTDEQSKEAHKSETKKSSEIEKPVQTAAATKEPHLKTIETEIESDDSESDNGDIHAGPGVRRLAREFGVDLTKISGSGAKQRILKEDIQAYVKNQLSRSSSATGVGLPEAPIVDFSQFGSTETISLSRIKKLSASNLHRNWLLIPHVTQFDEADISELELFRKKQALEAEKQGFKLTPLAFIIKATVKALKAFPHFNASLAPNGEQLILKHYFHIGVAVDTPEGLVVPVIRDADQKGIFELAKELAEVSQKARNKALTPYDMQGSSFSISSLGGIGGTAFAPIVNLPNVAILGVSRSSIKPVYRHETFVPRLILPLSVSYDHRVIDGAQGARFTNYLAKCLADLKLLLL